MYLVQPISSQQVLVSPSRLDVELTNLTAETPKDMWAGTIANASLWAVRLFSKPIVRDVVIETYSRLRLAQDDRFSYVQTLARIIDLAHSGQKLQTLVMAYPNHAVPLLKKRILALGYSLGTTAEDSMTLDLSTTLDIVKQVNKKLEKDHRFYFEFSAPHKVPWRVGFTLKGYTTQELLGYPGQDDQSFGFASDGAVHFEGKGTKYIDDPTDYSATSGMRTWGILVDMYFGNVSFVVDGKLLSPAFGAGATHFPSLVQRQQKYVDFLCVNGGLI